MIIIIIRRENFRMYLCCTGYFSFLYAIITYTVVIITVISFDACSPVRAPDIQGSLCNYMSFLFILFLSFLCMENNLTSQQALDHRNRSCASHDKCTHKRYLTAIFSLHEALLTDRKNVFFILYQHNVTLYLHVLNAVRVDSSVEFRVEIHRLHNVTFLMNSRV